MSSEVGVSVVLPAYDEEATLAATVETTLETLESFLAVEEFEVLIAEDGCTDRTPEIAAKLDHDDERVRHVHSDDRLGRGGALTQAFEAADGETLAYFDTDLATDMRHLEELITSVKSGEYDVATGSRLLAASDADRPAERDVPSRAFNRLVRLFLRSAVRDHQCGFKAFSREVFEDIVPEIEDGHWFWDTELLVRAQDAGYRVNEFPVAWTPMGDTKVDFVRDVLGMGSGVLRTWWQLGVAPKITRRVTFAAGTLLTVVAVLLTTQYLEVSSVLDAIEGADLVVVLASALVYSLSWPVRGARYRDILDELGFEENVGFLTGAVFVSQTGNLVFPARAGDAVRAYIVKTRRRVPYPAGFASLAVERVFDLLTITLLAGAVFLGLAATGASSLTQLGSTIAGGRASGQVAVVVAAGIGIVAVAAVLVIVTSARSDRNLVRSGLGRLSTDAYADRVASIVERFVGDVQTVASDPVSFARIGASSLLIWTLDVVTALVVFSAFDVSLPPVTLVAVGFFAVSVGNLAKVLPLSPGGIGLYEGAFTLLVVGLTPVALPVASAVAIVDHAVKNAVTVLGGVVSMAVLNVSLTTAVEESREVDDGHEVEATPTE